MNVPQIRDLILKTVGVYCLLISFSYVQMFLQALISPAGIGVRELSSFDYFIFVLSVVWAALSWVFLRRTDTVRRRIWPEDMESTAPVVLPRATVAFWVVVIAFYAFLRYADNFTTIGLRSIEAGRAGQPPFSFLGFAGMMVPPALAAACVFRAGEIGAWIGAPVARCAAEDTPHGPEGNA